MPRTAAMAMLRKLVLPCKGMLLVLATVVIGLYGGLIWVRNNL